MTKEEMLVAILAIRLVSELDAESLINLMEDFDRLESILECLNRLLKIRSV